MIGSAEQLGWRLPAVPPAVPRLRRAVVAFAAAAGASGAVLELLRLAVSEAVTNVVVHAYVEAPEPGEVRVTATVGEDSVRVTVADDGRGMVPRLDSPGLGLGLPLIAQSAETLDVHGGAGGGTEIRMTFRLG